ncbi:MAG: formate dehydrogenase accessory sulfurtransferase FdhD [Dehalococcoidia bacterium]
MEIENIEICKVAGANRETRLDSVIHEAEVAIKLDGRTRQRLFCLPTDLEELALGYLMSRGISTSDVGIEWKANKISVSAERTGTFKPKKVTSQLRITEHEVFNFIKRLDDNSPLFKKTGGTHVVGIFHGSRAVFVEDISRHCAIDKIIGLSLKQGIELSQSVLVTSCRQTLSTIRKAIFAQIPIVITISAPTDLAIESAHLSDITLVGFVRGCQFNIYSHDWRILRNYH